MHEWGARRRDVLARWLCEFVNKALERGQGATWRSEPDKLSLGAVPDDLIAAVSKHPNDRAASDVW